MNYKVKISVLFIFLIKKKEKVPGIDPRRYRYKSSIVTTGLYILIDYIFLY